MHLWLWATVVIAGATGQFFDALAGMGFGALSSTIMVSAGVSPVLVIATVNLAKVGSGLVSGMSHWRFGNVRWRWVLPLGLPAVAGGVLAAMAITNLPAQTARIVIPMVLLTMGLLILRRFLYERTAVPPIAGSSQGLDMVMTRKPWQVLTRSIGQAPPAAWLGSIGFVGGLLNGLSGAFGPFTTSAVVLKQGGHPRFAIGTVNFVELFVAAAVSVTLVSELWDKSFDWRVPLALMAGSVITAPFGAYLSRRLPARAVGVSVGLTLIMLNVWSIYRFIN